MIKKVLKKKAIKIAALTILVLFVLYNIVWAAFFLFKVFPYEKVLGYDDGREEYVLIGDDYSYSVGNPSYLRFTYNLAITQTRNLDENGELLNEYVCDLLIWPKLFGEDEYGVSIARYTNGNGVGYSFYLDSNMQPVNELTDEEKEFLEETSEEIEELYRRAFEMWPDLKDKAEN